MIFYQIENGKVIGWQYGTDIPGDPTSTGDALREWAKGAGRSLVVKEGHETEEAKFLKFENDDVRPMNSTEKQTVINAEAQQKQEQESLQDAAFEKIAAAADLSKDEKDAYKSRVAGKGEKS